MYKINVNNKFNFEVSENKDLKLNGRDVSWDLEALPGGKLHIIKDYKSYNAEVIEADYSTKTFSIKINNNIYTVEVKDQFDELLKNLGMDVLASSKVNEMKAPMPGLVVDVRVTEGQEILKGDPLLVLEAMKMENILKSPADGKVKKINVSKGDKVEKNQVLINFM
jgi:acetyl/propionyl-CoA carboxylase alpha subunit